MADMHSALTELKKFLSQMQSLEGPTRELRREIETVKERLDRPQS